MGVMEYIYMPKWGAFMDFSFGASTIHPVAIRWRYLIVWLSVGGDPSPAIYRSVWWELGPLL
jgi:hypothetical protein